MTDHVIHISEEEAARDFASLMARVRGGVEIVIESDTNPAAVLFRAAEPPRRSISESIVLAEARTKELGYKPVMDAGFSADLEEIIRHRKLPDTSTWANVLGLILDTSILIASERRGEGVDILPRVGRARRERCCTLGRQRRGADARHLPRQKRRRPRPSNLWHAAQQSYSLDPVMGERKLGPHHVVVKTF
jgi:antitoxin (DNA-binding transcriptional repressor) of toxin-antitoxin stability system